MIKLVQWFVAVVLIGVAVTANAANFYVLPTVTSGFPVVMSGACAYTFQASPGAQPCSITTDSETLTFTDSNKNTCNVVVDNNAGTLSVDAASTCTGANFPGDGTTLLIPTIPAGGGAVVPFNLSTSSGFPVFIAGCENTQLEINMGVPPQVCKPVSASSQYASIYATQLIGDQPNKTCYIDLKMSGGQWTLLPTTTCKTSQSGTNNLTITINEFPKNVTPSVSITGKYFYRTIDAAAGSTTERFMIRGIDFQPVDGIDPIADVDGNPNPVIQALFNPAAPYGWSNLNINAIRVYQVDPKQSHASTMAFLEQQGVYVIVGLANSVVNIPRTSSGAYYAPAFQAQIYGIIDEFQSYPNVLSFEVSNELAVPGSTSYNFASESASVAGAKSAAIDGKKYIAAQGYRQIPFGSAVRDTTCPPSGNCVNNQVGTNSTSQYYVCSASDASKRMDYVGINTYRYLNGGASIAAQTYETLLQQYNTANITVPTIFTEYEGNICPTSGSNRDFADVLPIYETQQLRDNLSGGFAFRYLSRTVGKSIPCIADSSKAAPFGLVYLKGWGAASDGAQPTTPITANDVMNFKPVGNNGYKNLVTAYKQAQTVGRSALLGSQYFNTQPTNISETPCPSNFNPPTCPVGENAVNNAGTWSCVAGQTPLANAVSITVQNQVLPSGKQRAVIVAQNNAVLKVIADSNSHTVSVDPTKPLYIQQNTTFDNICSVAANLLQAGSEVIAAEWGGACTVKNGLPPKPANKITIQVTNTATIPPANPFSIVVVQNDVTVATITDSNVAHAVQIDPTQALLLQQNVGTNYYPVCNAAANTLTANVNINTSAGPWSWNPTCAQGT